MASRAIARMKGLQKAAILLLSLGPDISAPVLRHIDEADLEQVTLEVFRLEKVPEEVKTEVLQECFRMAVARRFVTSGGTDFARQMLERAVGPDRSSEMIQRLLVNQRPMPFNFLKRVDPQQLLNFLQGEHPQTVALILSYLPSNLTARLMSRLPEELQGDVAMRVAQMDSTTPEIIENIEKVMQHKLSTVAPQEYTSVGGIQFLVRVLNAADHGTERAVLQQLEEMNSDLATEVRKLMFVFEDIIKLDDRSMQRLLRDVDSKDLALALKGASEELKEHIFHNLSSRAAEMLKEEIELSGPVRARNIEEARQRIVNTARRLEEAEEIVILRENDDIVV